MFNDSIIKPMLAKDVNFSKLITPPTGLMLLPKVDGSFAFIQNSKLFARSLKHHENIYTTKLYSNSDFEGLRGELIYGCDPCAPDLCRKTSSALRTVSGEPTTTLFCFDYVTHDTKNLPYQKRYAIMQSKVHSLTSKGYNNIHYINAYSVYTIDDIESLRNMLINEKYEGYVLRDPKAIHKEGRSSAVKPELWRWKPWLSAEILVTSIEEGETNLNEAKVNELGHTERSSHKENKVPNGMLGRIKGKLLADLLDVSGKVIQNAGEEITVSPGDMKHNERKFYLDNPNEIVGNIVEFDYFAYGMKDTVRMPQFKRIRSERDM